MADQSTGPLDIDLDLSQTKTSFPMVKDGELARWRLTNVRVDNTDKGKVVKFEYDLVAPAPNSDGGVINPGEPGAKFFDSVQLYAKADAKDPRWFEKKIAGRLDALLGTGDPGNNKGKEARPSFNAATVANILGKELVAKMGIRTGEYTGPEFKTVYFPGDVTQS